MNQANDPTTPITATSILSGLGSLNREEICTFLAILEGIGAISLAKGALEDVGKRMKLVDGTSVSSIDQAKQRLMDAPTSDAVLRHRLWVRLAEALMVPTTVPLSNRSARRAAASLAVRASERLTPSVVEQRKEKKTAQSDEDLAVLVGRKAADLWNAGKKLLARTDPMSFPDLVHEELLNMLADEDLVAAAAMQADPEIQDALRKAHGAAQKAIAAGGGWVAFATIVGNAGFLPYILAAQLSAWIPMVGGPALVSLLATLVNPLTVVAGLGSLGWLAVGKGSQVVRSQVAARICVLLAIPGSQSSASGLDGFLTDMRALDQEPPPAGSTPPPWNQSPHQLDVAETALVTSLTAGEMLWHAVAIDENVMQAADFSRAADLGDPLSFAAAAQSFVLKGAGYSLKGYAAERLVLDALVADGHDVELAEASNTPGLDLIVDGSPV
ncbi:hypothetical protein [Primorskyibacter sp. S87]|uniref:hypothetical protein n=1 Tax=Primorskyibacter sp. S87 TaxID=3415126 RepID=UPI003C7A3E5A